MRMALRGLALLVAALIVGPAWGQSSPAAGDVLKLLRGGGYVIVFRHGATNRDQADTDPLNPDNTARQRLLSEQGREVAKQLGEAFKTLGIPLS